MKFITHALLAASACLALMPPVLAQQAPTNSIEAINVAQQGNDIALKIDLKDALAAPPAGFSVANPAKIALDFPSTANGLGKTSQAVNEGDLRSLNIVQAGERTRLVLNLTRNMNYSTRIDGKSLFVMLTPIARVGDTTAQRVTRFSEESAVGGRHAVKDVLFRRGKDGEGRIIVDLSDAGTGIDIRQQGPNLIVDFMKTTVPDHLRRKLDVNDFATPVATVETRAQGDNVRMTISPKGLWEHNAYQSDSQFIVEVKKIVEDPNKLVQGSKVGYQGPRVSINYQNGDVRALLRLMAEELGLNAVISETVVGTTTLILKDVPADEVIDIIFQQKSLGMIKKDKIMIVAPKDELMVKAKLDGEARQALQESEPLKLEVYQLNYHNALEVKKLLMGEGTTLVNVGALGNTSKLDLTGRRAALVTNRGSANYDSFSNRIFVFDTPSSHQEIANFIRMIDIPQRQVLIEARVVEANDSFNKSLGVKLNFLNTVSTGIGGTDYRVGGGSYSTDGQVSNNLLGVNLPSFSSTGGTLALSLFNSSLTKILNLELAALESDGIGKIISSPRVITANNRKAKIEDGTEVPYVTPGTATSQPTVTFKAAKLSLDVTPQITPEGTVTMALTVKKEEPDWTRAILGNPPLKSSIVETNVVVDNGGTVVIGGVFVTSTQGSTEKVPFFGDIPYFGWLFKYKQDVGERRELLIFITPRILSGKMRLD